MKLTVTPGQVIPPPPPPPPDDKIVIELTPAEAGVLRNILLRTFWQGNLVPAVNSVVNVLWEELGPWKVDSSFGPYQSQGSVTVGALEETPNV